MRHIHRVGLAAAAGFSLACGTAWATPCDSLLSSYESYVLANDLANASILVSNHPECFSGGSGNSKIQIKGTSFTQANAISNALAMRQPVAGAAVVTGSTGLKGMAAGSPGGKWNVWGNWTNNDTRQSYTALNGFKARTNADIMTFLAGADYSLSPTMVLGVSAALDDGDGAGRNTAPGNTKNVIESSGYLIAPYLGIQINRELSFDASAGLGRGSIESNNNSEASADRWFAAANLSYNRWFDNVQLTGKASLLHGEEDYGNIKDPSTGLKWLGTKARNKLDQLRLSVQAGYWMNGVMPFLSLAYTNDFRRKTTQFGAISDPIGRDAWVWGLGANFYSLKDGVTGGIVYNQEMNRNNQNNHSLMANINFRF